MSDGYSTDRGSCPFCDAVQSDAPSPLRPAVASVLLGLALTACGGGTTGDEGAGTADTSVGTMGDSTAVSMSSTTMMSGVDTEGEEAVTAYGGPDVDTSPPEEETAGSTTMGDSTDTGTETGTGTGTGTETGTGGSSSSGQ